MIGHFPHRISVANSGWPLCRTAGAFAALLAVLITASGSARGGALDPDSIHWAAWDSALASAENEPALRYAWYAYRSLAVPHPEVYLLADSLFSEVVENIPGSRAAYRSADVRNLALFRRIQAGEQKGPSFDWRGWAATPDSIYDSSHTGAPLSWLDRRLPPAAVLLCAPSRRLSTAEATMLRFTQIRRSDAPRSLFVVIDTAGQGYLVAGDSVISPKTGNRWDGDPASVSPAIIFNERSVYYPLFERDDRGRDSSLSHAVAMFGPPGSVTLSPSERDRINRLRTAGALPSDRARRLASLVATGAVELSNVNVREAWRAVIPGSDTLPLGCEAGMVRLPIYWADRLSPNTARLAAAMNAASFDSSARQITREYHAFCGRRVNPRDSTDLRMDAWGYLWSYDMLDIVIDDMIRTRAGQSSSQALAMGACVDLAGYPNMRLQVLGASESIPDQHWIIADRGRWQFNLGNWKQVPEVIDVPAKFPLVIGSYGITGAWTNFLHARKYATTDNLQVGADLMRLVTETPLAFLQIAEATAEATHHHYDEKAYRLIPIQEVMRQLAADEIDWNQLPWPDAGPPAPAGSGSAEGQ